jgi:hypothetical protein
LGESRQVPEVSKFVRGVLRIEAFFENALKSQKGENNVKKRKLHAKLVLFAAFFLGAMFIGTSLTTVGAGQRTFFESKVKRGLEIAPVHLNLRGKNVALVGEGSYIVNAVGGCNDCHSCPSYQPGHNPYQPGGDGKINSTNYLAGGVPFGPFFADNITPDADGLPAGMTFKQFLDSMRTGNEFHINPPPISPIVQVMPWPAYRNMTDGDFLAIYEYLRAIPHAEPGTCTGAGE